MHQLNRGGVGAGIKEGPVQSEVRNGMVLFGGSDALGRFSCHVSCALISRALEPPAKAEAGRSLAEGAIQAVVPPRRWINPVFLADSVKRINLRQL